MGQRLHTSILGLGFILTGCGADPSSGSTDFGSGQGSPASSTAQRPSGQIPTPAEILARGVSGSDEDLTAVARNAHYAVNTPRASTVSAAKLTAPLSEYVQFPGGKLLHQSCVHSFPSGAHIGENGDVVDGKGHVLEHVAPCQYDPISSVQAAAQGAPSPSIARAPDNPADGNGNIEYVYAHPVTAPWFDGVATQVTVPPTPQDYIGTTDIYMWSGLDRVDTAHLVLQPVLQWGGPAAACNLGGGNWEMEVYYIDVNNNGFCGAQQEVMQGQTITEYTLAASCPDNSGVNCSWLIAYVLNNTTFGGFTPPVPVAPDTAVFQSFEAYQVPKCAFMPSGGGTTFLSAWYEPVSSWSSYNQDTQISGGTVGPTVQSGTGVESDCPFGVAASGIADAILGEVEY